MKSEFKKIATKAVIMALTVTAAQMPLAKNNVAPDDAKFVKNVGIGAVVGTVVSVIANNGKVKPLYVAGGAALGVGNYLAAAINQNKNDGTEAQDVVYAQLGEVPNKESNQIRVGSNSINGKDVEKNSDWRIVRTMPTSLMKNVEGKTPSPRTVKNKDGTLTITGDSMQDIVYGIGAIMSLKHGMRLDVLSTDAALLRQQSVFTEIISIKLDPNSAKSVMDNLHKVAKKLNMGMLYEEKTNYVVLANQQIVRRLVSNPILQTVANSSGVTSQDIDEALKIIAQTPNNNYRVNYNYGKQPQNNKRQGSNVVSYEEMTMKERQRRAAGRANRY